MTSTSRTLKANLCTTLLYFLMLLPRRGYTSLKEREKFQKEARKENIEVDSGLMGGCVCPLEEDEFEIKKFLEYFVRATLTTIVVLTCFQKFFCKFTF